MNETTVDAILLRTKEYILKHKKQQFSFIFHGGEPLLASKEFYSSFISKANDLLEELSNVTFIYELQTNGVLLDYEWISLFKTLKIHPSLSIDGTQKAHDMFRVDHKGNGSYSQVLKGAHLIKKHIQTLDIVCVINTSENPEEVYKSFKKMRADSVNFLIPDYTHDNFAPEKNGSLLSNWLIKLFNSWIHDKERYKIPMFIGFINRFMRFQEHVRNESTVLIVETNGEIEAIDSLKACGENFTKTGLTILKNSFEDIKRTQLGSLYFGDYTSKLCHQCKECPLNEICNGGRLVHRYSKEKGFDNPSIYCYDLIDFIAHVQHYFMSCFPEIHASENIEAINPKEIKIYLDSLASASVLPNQELEAFSYNQLLTIS